MGLDDKSITIIEEFKNEPVIPTPQDTNNKKRTEKGVIILPVLVVLLVIYYLSPLSIYFWHTSLNFIIHIFYFPFYVLPEDFFVASGGPVAVPNPITIGFAALLSLAFIYFFSRMLYYIAGKVGLKYKFIFSLSVILIFAILGGFGEQEYCEYSFSKFKNYTGENYLKNTGVISFVLNIQDNYNYNIWEGDQHPFLTRTGSNILYKLTGIKYLKGEPNFGRIIAQVNPGKEASKLCKLKAYRQVADISSPVTESQLFGNIFSEYWEYINPNFCETGQLTSHSKNKCLLSIENKRPYLMDMPASISQGSDIQSENFDSKLVSFDYPSIYKIDRQTDNDTSVNGRLLIKERGNRFFAGISVDKSEVPTQLAIAYDYERRQKGDNEWNPSEKNLQLLKIGEYEYYKWQEGEGTQESTRYETLIGGNFVLSIMANYPGYENYTKDIEDIIKTIKVKAGIIDDENITLKYDVNSFIITRNKGHENEVWVGNYEIYPATDNTLPNGFNEAEIYIEKKTYLRDINMIESDMNQIKQSDGSTTSQIQRIKLGKYEYIKTVSKETINYKSPFGKIHVSVVLDFRYLSQTDENVKKIEDLLVNIQYKFNTE